MPVNYATHEFQIADLMQSAAIQVAGGLVYVTAVNGAAKLTLYDADTNLALANPVVPVRGKVRFATLATVAAVDLYGISGNGISFVRRNMRPGADPEIFVADAARQLLIVPFSKADVAANVEIDTGFDLPQDCVISPFGMGIDVLTLEATRTILVGLLSAETAGDADGFLALVSLAADGLINWSTAGTPTLGALLVQNFGTTPAVNVAKQHTIIGTNARSLTYTLSAATASAAGFIQVPYVRKLAA